MAELQRLGPDATVDEVCAGLDRDGVVLVERFITPDKVAALKDELAPHRTTTPAGRNDFEGFDTRRIYALFAKARGFDELALHPLLLGVLDRVLGPDYQLSAPVGIDIGPGETAQFLHQDDVIYPLPFPHREVVFNTMWALDDFTTENGATRVVIGSHRTPHDHDPAPDDAVDATMPAGSVLFYNGTVWHGGGANRTTERRLGVILEYVASWLRAQETHLIAVPPEIVRTLPERLQELLGWNIYPPFVGYVDGRHPRRFL